MIKRLSYLMILCSVSFFVGSVMAPKMDLTQSQKINMLVQQQVFEDETHNGVVVGHISGQYQHIYKQKKK